MFYDQSTHLYRYPLPIFIIQNTRNNTSSLYQGKPGIMRLACVSLVQYCNTPYPLKIQQTPRGRIFKPNSEKNPSDRVETWDPVSTNAIILTPSTTAIASLAWPSNHTKGLELWHPGSASISGLNGFPGSLPLGSMSLE